MMKRRGEKLRKGDDAEALDLPPFQQVSINFYLQREISLWTENDFSGW